MLLRAEWSISPSLRAALGHRAPAHSYTPSAPETEEMAELRIASELEAVMAESARRRGASKPADALSPPPIPRQAESESDDAPDAIDIAALYAKPDTAPDFAWLPDEALAPTARAVPADAAAWVERARQERRRSRTHHLLSWCLTIIVGAILSVGAAYAIAGWTPDFQDIADTIAEAMIQPGG